MEIFKFDTKKKPGDAYGGSDNRSDYNNRGGRGEHYSDKGGHAERSKSNQPNHREHWKKEEKKGQKQPS